MTGEENTKEIVYFAFVPVGSVVEGGDAGNGGCFIGIGLDTDAGVVSDGEEIVDDFEALFAGREIACCDGAHLGEFGPRVV